MNQPPRQVGSSPQQGRYLHASPSLAHNTPLPANEDADIVFLQRMMGTPQSSGVLHDSFDPGFGAANDLNQYHTPHYSFGADRTDLHNVQASTTAIPFVGQNDQCLVRGTANHVVSSTPGTRDREATSRGASFFHGAPPTYLVPQMQSACHQAHPSPQLVDCSATLYGSTMERQTKYPPFEGRFHDAQHARSHRRRETLFGRAPYISDDESIAKVEKNRVKHVGEIYNAMTSGHLARDNSESIAMKRWTKNAYYSPDLVEAYAHKVFDCLLQQAKEGFRGWEHNDYVADERKADDVDREVDCEGRLGYIVEALQHEKTICEDVMNSACQIRMFVNAPRAYANRKHQNRIGNSKRGKGKGAADANPRPAKVQRTNRRNRAQSSAAPEMPSSRDTTPQRQQAMQHVPTTLPYFYSPASHKLSLSPTSANYTAPQLTPLHRPQASTPRSSFTSYSTPANPPPHSSPQPYTSPAPHGPFSPTTSPSDPTPPAPTAWHDIIQFNQLSPSPFSQTEAVDPNLSDWTLASSEPGATTDIFDQCLGGYVNPAHIQYSMPDCLPSHMSDPIPPSWAMQSGMQSTRLQESEAQNQKHT